MVTPVYILAIESSCDDTAAAVLKNSAVLSNAIAGQKVHEAFGGVVPELASRAHQQNIVPVVHQALNKANISLGDLHAIAFTKGPGLLGSLLVGMSFAKSLAMALNIPLIEVNHMQAHILAHFIDDAHPDANKEDNNFTNHTIDIYSSPSGRPGVAFPFLALTVSGGHTQIVRVDDFFDMAVIGETTDDAVGEAFDKTAKLLGLPYPGGPLIDRLAQGGNPQAYTFTKPKMNGYNFSFSGIKTGIMNFLNNQKAINPKFVEDNLADICASVQHSLIDILLEKLSLAIRETGIKNVAIGGGVSANSELRKRIGGLGQSLGCKTYIPKFEYTTDNAAMIGIVGYYKYLNGNFTDEFTTSKSRYTL